MQGLIGHGVCIPCVAEMDPAPWREGMGLGSGAAGLEAIARAARPLRCVEAQPSLGRRPPLIPQASPTFQKGCSFHSTRPSASCGMKSLQTLQRGANSSRWQAVW
jgi:hypothetical protein